MTPLFSTGLMQSAVMHERRQLVVSIGRWFLSDLMATLNLMDLLSSFLTWTSFQVSSPVPLGTGYLGCRVASGIHISMHFYKCGRLDLCWVLGGSSNHARKVFATVPNEGIYGPIS